MSLDGTSWIAHWPADGDALARALAVSAAFRERFGSLNVLVAGDVQAAVGATLEALAGDGLSDSDLPDVALAPVGGALPGAQPVRGLAEAFALACERELRAAPPRFSVGDPDDRVVAEAARVALGHGSGSVALIGDGLDGIAPLAEHSPVTVVALSPLAHRVADALSQPNPVVPVARPPHPARMPAADIVALDGRRPEDLRLALGTNASTVAIGRAERLGTLALAAYGLELAERQGDVALAVPAAARVPATR